MADHQGWLACRTHPGPGFLAATTLAWFLEISVGADFTHDAFLIQFLLKAAQCAVNGFTFTYFHFRHDY